MSAEAQSISTQGSFGTEISARWGSSFDQRYLLLAARASIYFVLVILTLLFQLSQIGFYNWATSFLFYSLAGVGLLFHGVNLLFIERLFRSPRWHLVTFLFDVLMLSFLLNQSGLSNTLFIFLFLIVILLSGLSLQTRGAWVVACAVSLGYSVATLFGPDVRAIPMFFGLIINNSAFLAVAWISGALAEQLELQGVSLNVYRHLTQSIVNTIPSGIVTILENGSILHFNPAARSLLGGAIENISGFQQLLPEAEKLVEQARIHGKKVVGDIRLVKDTENLILSMQVVPQNTMAGQGFLLIFEDLTVVRRLEFAMKQKEKLAAIGSLVTGIAHEIRNPLAGMSGNLELALDANLEPDLRAKVSRNVFKEIDRLNRIISELMDYAKPEKVPVDRVQLDSSLREILDILAQDPQTPPHLKVHRELVPVPEIRGDRDKLKQAFLNIVLNSIQAMSKTENPVLEVFTNASPQFVEVRVKDNGCGMSEETRKKMFEPFVTTKAKGTGLGLAITHKILEAHKVQIEVYSEQGQGTEFRLYFPRELNEFIENNNKNINTFN